MNKLILFLLLFCFINVSYGQEIETKDFRFFMNRDVESSSKVLESNFVSPLNTYVITQEDIQLYGSHNIIDVLRHVPGLIISERTPDNYDMHIRGLNNLPDGFSRFHNMTNSQCIILIDGHDYTDYTMGIINLHKIPVSVSDIKRIEIIEGAASALYGLNACQGVINIITHDTHIHNSSQTFGFISNNAYGIYNTLNVDVNDKFDVELCFSSHQTKRFTDKLYLHKSSVPENDPLRRPDLLWNGKGWNGGWVDKNTILDSLRVFSWATDKDYYVPYPKSNKFNESYENTKISSKDNILRVRFNITPDYMTNQHSIVLSYYNNESFDAAFDEHPWSMSQSVFSSISADVKGNIKKLHYNVNSRFEKSNEDVYTPGYTNKLYALTSTLSWMDIINKNFTYGAELFQRNWNVKDNKDGIYESKKDEYIDIISEKIVLDNMFSNKTARFNTIGAGVRGEYHNKLMRIICAMRYDHVDNPKQNVFSYNIAATFNLNDKSIFRVSTARASKSPYICFTQESYTIHREGMTLPTYTRVNGNDYKIQTTDNYELGYRYRNHKFELDLTLFQSYSRNLSGFNIQDGAFYATREQITKLLVDGLQNGPSAFTRDKLFDEYTYQLVNMNMTDFNIKPKQTGVLLDVRYLPMKNLIIQGGLMIQRTKVDDYYPYDQVKSFTDILYRAGATLERFMMFAGEKGKTDFTNYYMQCMMQGKQPDINEFMNNFVSDVLYVGMKEYGIEMSQDGTMFKLAKGDADTVKPVNNHIHKTTPAYVANLNVSYSPFSKMSISAMSYFMGKRHFNLAAEKVDIKSFYNIDFNVKYDITNSLCVGITTNKLFTNQKQEFVYMDELDKRVSLSVNIKL